MTNKTCKCGNKDCLGFLLLHEKELRDLDKIKYLQQRTHGSVYFNLTDSPSSGEIFTKFYELHVLKVKFESCANCKHGTFPMPDICSSCGFIRESNAPTKWEGRT